MKSLDLGFVACTDDGGKIVDQYARTTAQYLDGDSIRRDVARPVDQPLQSLVQVQLDGCDVVHGAVRRSTQVTIRRRASRSLGVDPGVAARGRTFRHSEGISHA